MKDKTIDSMIEDAKLKYKDDPEMTAMLEETQAEVSELSRIKGTQITLNNCELL
jgi:hypothetical protein